MTRIFTPNAHNHRTNRKKYQIRKIKKKGSCTIEFITGDAEQLPFDDESFDAYTIAFGLRNVTNLDQAIAEARRVLKQGGRFMCLEFSHGKKKKKTI